MSFFDGDNQSQDDNYDRDINHQDDRSSCMDYFHNNDSNVNQNINNHADQFSFDESGLSDYPADCSGNPFEEQHDCHMDNYFNDGNNTVSEHGNGNNDDCFFNIPSHMDNNANENICGNENENENAMVVMTDINDDQYTDHHNNQFMNVSCCVI